MSARLYRVVASLVTAAVMAAACPALAQSPPAGQEGPPAPQDGEQAKRDFATGSDHMREGAYEEALAAFTASNRALPSPNTTLMIARCLRALGRLEEAVERFEAATVDADARVAAGETRYQQAATTARAEGASLRGNLGVLHLRLAGAATVTAVEVDGRRSPLRPDGTVAVLHRPGDVHYRILEGETVRLEGRATLAAGRWTSVDVVVPAREAAPIATAPPASTGWMFPAAIGAGALGVVGLGSFAVFGVRSQTTFDDLRDRCAPHCGVAERDAADKGDREQTIANVSLVIGAIALGAGIALGVVALARRSPDKAASR
jgi:hypothetical protein